MKIGKLFAVTVLQTLLLAFLLYLTYIVLPIYGAQDAAAIGIIGGADGPTAIFVAYDGNVTMYLSFFVIFVVSFITNMCTLFDKKIYSRLALILGGIALLCFWIIPFTIIHKAGAVLSAIVGLAIFWGGYWISSRYIR